MATSRKHLSRNPALAISPVVARFLSVLSIGSLWGWFFLKFFLSDASDGLAFMVGSLALLGVGGGMTLFASQYLNQAYAKEHELDERELAQRNRAYRYTVNYVIVILVLSYVASESILAQRPDLLSPGVVSNFITALFFTTVAFTPAVLAWKDRGSPDEDERPQ
jgi:polyferredoxin